MAKRRSSWLAGIALMGLLGFNGTAFGQACATGGCSTAPAPAACGEEGCSTGCATESCGDSCVAAPACGATGYSCSDASSILNGCGTGCADEGCGVGGCSMGGGSCGDCCLGDPWELCDGSGGIDVGGWLQFGYHSNVTPLSTVRNEGFSFNDHPDRVNLHQAWMYIEKTADGSNGADFGFRADIMYGVDAAQTQAFGNPAGSWDFGNGWDNGAGYGWALPQLYGEIASGDLSIIAGHFYTLIGYEVVTAPDNFFYSHAYTMFNSEPFTHTGALATYAASDNLEVYGGWTAGWDTGFDQFEGGSSFLGGFSTSLSENASFTYITTAGDLGWRGNDGYTHSIVVDVTLSDKLNYVFQSDYVNVDDFVQTDGFTNEDFGINNYLFYTINDCLAFGTRLEWWSTDAGGAGSEDFFGATFGANYRPHANIIFRPEVRYDDTPTGDQTTFGMDAIFTF